MSKQKGQVLVFYALMVPTLMMFFGAAYDFGWWYLNQSRLQNAADAAVVAGAYEIAPTAYVNLVDNDLTKTEGYTSVPDSDTILQSGKVVAMEYVRKNVEDETQSEAIKDSWTSLEVEFKNKLYKLASENSGDSYYYIVDLKEEKLAPLLSFISDINMNLNVRAVARISDKPQADPDSSEGINILEGLKAGNVIVGNWEIQNKYRNTPDSPDYKKLYGTDSSLYVGKWNHYQNRNDYKEISYTAGNKYRTETVAVGPSVNGYTPANGSRGKGFDWTELESINIDFKQDISFSSVNADWDIDQSLPSGAKAVHNNGWSNSELNLRVHALINFDEAYKARPDHVNDPYPDVLWARIESEPMWSKLTFKTMKELDSVRQIILNINASNFDTSTQKYRPIMFFYDGPEHWDGPAHAELSENDRVSQPVILNLNADFRGVLYMPDSPVIINGGGKFEGFIVAKEFLTLKTADDFTESVTDSGVNYTDKATGAEAFYASDSKVFVDEHGNVLTKPYTGSMTYGTYNTFGISEFSTHNYKLVQHSNTNLFLSGK